MWTRHEGMQELRTKCAVSLLKGTGLWMTCTLNLSRMRWSARGITVYKCGSLDCTEWVSTALLHKQVSSGSVKQRLNAPFELFIQHFLNTPRWRKASPLLASNAAANLTGLAPSGKSQLAKRSTSTPALLARSNPSVTADTKCESFKQ